MTRPTSLRNGIFPVLGLGLLASAAWDLQNLDPLWRHVEDGAMEILRPSESGGLVLTMTWSQWSEKRMVLPDSGIRKHCFLPLVVETVWRPQVDANGDVVRISGFPGAKFEPAYRLTVGLDDE